MRLLEGCGFSSPGRQIRAVANNRSQKGEKSRGEEMKSPAVGKGVTSRGGGLGAMAGGGGRVLSTIDKGSWNGGEAGRRRRTRGVEERGEREEYEGDGQEMIHRRTNVHATGKK